MVVPLWPCRRPQPKAAASCLHRGALRWEAMVAAPSFSGALDVAASRFPSTFALPCVVLQAISFGWSGCHLHRQLLRLQCHRGPHETSLKPNDIADNLLLAGAGSRHGEEHPKQDVLEPHCSHVLVGRFAKAARSDMVYVPVNISCLCKPVIMQLLSRGRPSPGLLR